MAFQKRENADVELRKAKVKVQREAKAKKEAVQKAELEKEEGSRKCGQADQDHGDCRVVSDGAWDSMDGEGGCSM